jgi:isopenicillin-N N-acyltransferase-like protein
VTPAKVSDNCTAFLVPNDCAEGQQGFYGQTWDMHDTATPYVILINGKPDNAPDFLAFTITGCVGMIGMNSEGIAVGINNLMSTDGQVGVTWPFVVRKVLQQDNLDDALACITDAKLAGAHNFMLMDKLGDGYNVEAMSTSIEVEKLDSDAIAHTNHCLVDHNLQVARERPEAAQQSSENRLNRAYDLLAKDAVTVDDLIALTRDEESICVRPKPPMNVESCGAAIMRPATGDFWAVWGLPVENEYEHFTV